MLAVEVVGFKLFLACDISLGFFPHHISEYQSNTTLPSPYPTNLKR